jgi:2-polyprenyl-6-methoxyphenol hydroxylase-like FAD-dependent oxidoreductase
MSRQRQEFNILLCKADPKPWGEHNAVTEKVTFEEMMADFEGPGVDERLRRLLAMARPIKWGFFHHLNTSTYCRGRAVLMGDSAHASLPFQANGAAQGLEDALILSEVLVRLAKIPASDPDSLSRIAAGLAAYDSVRRPRAQKQLETAAEVGRMLFLQHEIDGDDMSKLLPRLQSGHFEWIWFHDINKDVEEAVSKMEAREDSPVTTPYP